jgi:hypothetical protein
LVAGFVFVAGEEAPVNPSTVHIGG